MVSVVAVMHGIREVASRTGRAPDVLRCAPRVMYDLQRAAMDTPGAIVPHQPTAWERAALASDDGGLRGAVVLFMPTHDVLYGLESVVGMRIETDEYLPAGVWRLTDADETLLYDCREGTPAL